MSPTFASGSTQNFTPAPSFTEKDVPDLSGKVYIVTGTTSGMGSNLPVSSTPETQSPEGERSYYATQKAEPSSDGSLVFLSLDLADLQKVKEAAEQVLATETKLHVLFNNAA
ncbi:unnamed protein product [Clonostachys solani]|uniref:Uncharacterized protein n=1 Tax=Clonostachys solani TaxID=160281 RepID=A0A9N9ZJS4_9HYPO|nr:unnamed protein product [Clonostachys solani]